MSDALPTIAVLGAAGLIGQAVAEALARDGFPVVAVARRFTAAQAAAFGAHAVVCPIADLDADALGRLLADRRADIVLNCLGVLQDGPHGSTHDVHEALVARLLQAIAAQPRPVLLMHVSIPGDAADDATPFSRSKRTGERLIADADGPHAILRPGFVIAPAAYGGSALLRALAASPFRLPDALAGRPFAATAVADIAGTAAVVARRWQAGERHWRAVWDVMGRHPLSVGGVVEAFRRRFGGPTPRLALPGWLLDLGAGAGDLAARLGWSPPVRTTALREMRRGVEGDPARWIAETGIEPVPAEHAIATLPATVQERWFARLYVAKPLVIACLVLFWTISALIALTVAFTPATAILTAHGFPTGPAQAVTVVSSLVDLAVGLAIAGRRTCRAGLLAGIAVSLFYMAAAAVLTPEIWVEPLGALVKTGPAIVLMAVALLILDDR